MMALTTAGQDPIAPASPAPFTPSGLVVQGMLRVSKLIGATDTFIHRPFYYTGALLGLCSGALALGGVALALRPLNTAIATFARLYASEFQLVPLAPLPMAGLLALSAALGLVGAVLYVQRHLARLN